MPRDMIHQKCSEPVELEKATSDLSDRNPRSLGVHSGGDIHRLKLLEKQFGRIGQEYLRDSGLVVARSALECLFRVIPVVTVSPNPSALALSGSTYTIGVIKPQMSQMCTR